LKLTSPLIASSVALGRWATAALSMTLISANDIAHVHRRAARAGEFAPLDKIISLQLPGMDMTATEDGRQLIRDKYADMQVAIDAAATPMKSKPPWR
jgi:hypothetical protein